ncbi:hypothetical protein B0H13DRAFT_2021366 [Mycena leptocephala]|nr:hypothetical protein B0H13DRAFT_2021366 [Mycena leptocephala]
MVVPGERAINALAGRAALLLFDFFLRFLLSSLLGRSCACVPGRAGYTTTRRSSRFGFGFGISFFHLPNAFVVGLRAWLEPLLLAKFFRFWISNARYETSSPYRTRTCFLLLPGSGIWAFCQLLLCWLAGRMAGLPSLDPTTLCRRRNIISLSVGPGDDRTT